jgi:hypothetical protein
MGHFPFSEKHLMSDDLPKVCLKCESFVIYCLSDKQIGYNFAVKNIAVLILNFLTLKIAESFC